MPYSWPLDHPPKEIGAGFKVIRPLGRGFYAATYLVESGKLGRQDVLKVTPAAFYEKGLKRTDFVEESRQHMRVADGTIHLAKIRDIFGEDEGGCDIDFDGRIIPCYVAVLDYVPGRPLHDYITGEATLSARSAAQIAIDLLALLRELDAKGVQHNDLHESNIMVAELPQDARRAQAIDERIRAVAVDLGSVAETSPNAIGRLGDVHQVARHLHALSVRLLGDPEGADDDDYRLASALDRLSQQMRPQRVNQRAINYEEQIERIRDTVFLTDSPWRDPGALPRFGEAYNAATLKSWYVPKLLVDPGEEWRRAIAVSGPQLITGMRGCGKTMLLRALEIHGRAVGAQERSGGNTDSLGDELGKDHWVGLYESATRLLDTLGDDSLGAEPRPLHEPNARLLIAYAREAIQALRHLSYLNPGLVVNGYAKRIGTVVADHIPGAAGLRDVDADVAVERALQRYLIDLAEHKPGLEMAANPAVAFPHLAEAIKQGSPLWHNAVVFFLLDDVSTRNLRKENIKSLWSSLLFKDERCAFKMTTEAQTVEQLHSPGLVETAQIGRDVAVFPLDLEVNERMRERGPNGGRSFIGSILEHRASHYSKHPDVHPEQILGGGTLEAIARNIAGAAVEEGKDTGAARRQLAGAYRGINALSAVCVGDIGDVISIYETMLPLVPNSSLPLAADKQNEAFQKYSRRRLYHLKRRGDDLQMFALSFARAAHELLADSYRRGGRLRQYSSIHVQIDPESQSEEYKKILRLVDAGVFVFEPGHRTRLRSNRANPTASFILNYRKLFGLFNFIGLAERDRFELRGEAITEWLENPGDHTVLTRRLGITLREDYVPPEPTAYLEEEAGKLFSDEALEALDGSSRNGDEQALQATEAREQGFEDQFLKERIPFVEKIEEESFRNRRDLTLVVGLGFEERTRESAVRMLETAKPASVIAVRYPEPGYGSEIEDAVQRAGIDLEILDYKSIPKIGSITLSGPLLVDTTGLTKSLIFSLVRSGLVRDQEMIVAHTRAEEHWPLNETIQELLDEHGRAIDANNYYDLMEAVRAIASGEERPYVFDKLLPGDGDQSRSRALCAAVTAKHERLLEFLDRREYDEIQISAPDSGSPRSRMAWIAAQIAAEGDGEAHLLKVGADDLPAQILFLAKRYQDWYHQGMEIEFALTGSKMHAVACAALSSSLKVAQSWYVRPSAFDASRFSRGTGATELFSLRPAPIVAAGWTRVSSPEDELSPSGNPTELRTR